MRTGDYRSVKSEPELQESFVSPIKAMIEGTPLFG
jgi:hypothetical protein